MDWPWAEQKTEERLVLAFERAHKIVSQTIDSSVPFLTANLIRIQAALHHR